MAQANRWLLPEGIEELLPEHAALIELWRRQLLDLYFSWGYELVFPPLVEYLDSLLIGVGYDLDLKTVKIIDQETGRLLGIRADITPQVARIDAHRLNHSGPTRLCYIGNVLLAHCDDLSRTRSPLQIGAEIYGHAGIESDFEVVRLMVASLNAVGVKDIHLDFGHVGIFRGIAQCADISAEQERHLFAALQRKDQQQIEDDLAQFNVNKKFRQLFVELSALHGGKEVLQEAKHIFNKAHGSILGALQELEQLINLTERFLNGVKLHFDLGELRGYNYHTGLVFAAFTPGFGQEIAKGGRYDNIGKVFGRGRPATGFSTDLKTLLSLSSAKYQVGNAILAPAFLDPALEPLIETLRARGERVIYALPGHHEIAHQGCDRMLKKQGKDWQIVTIEKSS